MANQERADDPNDLPTWVYALIVFTYISLIVLFSRLRRRIPFERIVERRVYAGFVLSTVIALVVMLALMFRKPPGRTPSIMKTIGVHNVGIMIVNAGLGIWREGEKRRKRDAENVKT